MKPLFPTVTASLAAVAVTAVLITSCAAPLPQPTASDRLTAQEQWEREHPLSPAVQTALDRTVRELRDLLASAFPEYNGVHVSTSQVQGESSNIFASHPMFSEYSLSVGPAGRAVDQWVAERRQQLRTAHVRSIILGPSTIYMDMSQ
jgi:hypothetical protein